MISYDYDCGTGGTPTNVWRPYVTNTSSSAITVEYDNELVYYSDSDSTCASTWGTAWYDCGDATTTGGPWKQLTRAMKRHAATSAATMTFEGEHLARLEVQWWERQGRIKPEDRLRDIIRDRQAPYVITSRKHLQPPRDIREVRARETLCRVLGEQKFRSFLKNGFVSVKAKSGLVYQIFPGHDITKVYKDGELTERLCVVLKGSFPPTDSLIMRYLLILNDERDFRKHAIKHGVHQPSVPKPVDQRPLTEIFKELKVA